MTNEKQEYEEELRMGKGGFTLPGESDMKN